MRKLKRELKKNVICIQTTVLHFISKFLKNAPPCSIQKKAGARAMVLNTIPHCLQVLFLVYQVVSVEKSCNHFQQYCRDYKDHYVAFCCRECYRYSAKYEARYRRLHFQNKTCYGTFQYHPLLRPPAVACVPPKSDQDKSCQVIFGMLEAP